MARRLPNAPRPRTGTGTGAWNEPRRSPQMVTSTSATTPLAAVTLLSTGSVCGARVRSVHSPGLAKNRKCPVAEVGTSAVNSPVASSNRTYAPPTGSSPRSTWPWITASLSTSTPLRSRPPFLAPHMSGLPGLVAEGDRYADQRTPLGPRTVVVLDVLLTEQLVQHEPGVRGALADPAVRDGVLAEVDPGVGVQGLQLVVGAEGAVVVGRLAPRDAGRGRDVTRALRLLLRKVSR